MHFNELNNIWFFISLVITFFYSILALQFSGKILQTFTKSIFLLVIFSLINAYIIVSFYAFFAYFIGLFFFFVEYSILSKSSLRQKLFGSSVFLFHIGSIHLVVVVIFTQYLNINGLQLISNSTFYYQSISITYFVLSLVLLLVDKIIHTEDLQKISNAKTYSKILSIITISIIALLTLESFLIFSPTSLPYLELIVIGTTVFSYLIFYFFFLYSMNFVTMYVYKRKNEQIKNSHLNIIFEKQKLEQRIVKDSLTNLYTKKFIYDTLQRMCAIEDAKYAVLFIDLCGLKNVNDTYGHKVGDDYICKIAKAIQKSIREEDIAARIGGDEFIILLDFIEQNDIELIISRLNQTVQMYNEKSDFLIAIYIGTVYVNNLEHKQDFDEIVALADQRMREKKKEFYKNRDTL